MIIPSEDNEYAKILCLGELDNILIYSLTSKVKMSIGCPDNEYLRDIYRGLKKTFHPYSEYLLMYYVYRLEGRKVMNYFEFRNKKSFFYTAVKR